MEYTISNFHFSDKRASVNISKDGKLWERVGIGCNADYSFKDYQQQYIKDLLVTYAITSIAVFAKTIYVSIPCSWYVTTTAKKLANDLITWTYLMQGYFSTVDITFLDKPEDAPTNVFIEKDVPVVIVGDSNGKESLACEKMSLELGYDVHKIFVGKTSDDEDICTHVYMFCEESSERVTPQYTAAIDKQMLFSYQESFSLLLYGLLALHSKERNASMVAVGAEFGCSMGLEINGCKVYDLPCEEGILTIDWLNGYYKSTKSPLRIYSPVSTLHEVAIMRYIFDGGWSSPEKLQSCWNYAYFNTNCEGCIKCDRLKEYIKYLIKKGAAKEESYSKCFLREDQPYILTPEHLSYSVYLEKMQSDIMGITDSGTDWSSVYINHPDELRALGPYFAVIQKHFKEYDHRQLYSANFIPMFRSHPLNLCKSRVAEFLGHGYEDYGEEAITPVKMSLPYEELWEAEITWLQKTNVWPVYDELQKCIGYIRIGDAPIELLPMFDEKSISRKWLRLSAIQECLDKFYPDITYKVHIIPVEHREAKHIIALPIIQSNILDMDTYMKYIGCELLENVEWGETIGKEIFRKGTATKFVEFFSGSAPILEGLHRVFPFTSKYAVELGKEILEDAKTYIPGVVMVNKSVTDPSIVTCIGNDVTHAFTSAASLGYITHPDIVKHFKVVLLMLAQGGEYYICAGRPTDIACDIKHIREGVDWNIITDMDDKHVIFELEYFNNIDSETGIRQLHTVWTEDFTMFTKMEVNYTAFVPSGLGELWKSMGGKEYVATDEYLKLTR